MKKLLLILFLFSGTTLYSAVNRYSVITLENLTPYSVHYIYGWGPGNESQSSRNSIAPFGSYSHWWEFGYPGENWAPWFWLKIDGQRNWHRLGSYFSPNTSSENSAHYYFVDYEFEDGSYEIDLLDEYDMEFYYWW